MEHTEANVDNQDVIRTNQEQHMQLKLTSAVPSVGCVETGIINGKSLKSKIFKHIFGKQHLLTNLF